MDKKKFIILLRNRETENNMPMVVVDGVEALKEELMHIDYSDYDVNIIRVGKEETDGE